MKNILLALVTVCYCSSFSIAGQKVIVIPANGEERAIHFTPEDSEFVVLVSSNSNKSSRVIFGLKSSVEILVEASTRKAKRSVQVSSLGSVKTGWNSKAIDFFAGDRGVSKFRMGGSSAGGEQGLFRDPNCSCLTEPEILELLTQNPSYTRDSLCAFLRANLGTLDCSIFGNSGQNQTLTSQAIGIELRDTCDKNSKSVTRFVLKPNVNLANYPQGIIVNISFKNEPFAGAQGMSVKPVSEGKTAPHPLFLSRTMGLAWGSTKEFIRVSQWRGSKLSRVLDLKGGDSDVYYRGMILNRTIASKALSMGGKAVVDLRSNAGVTYGFCMRMSRSRQYYGSYSR